MYEDIKGNVCEYCHEGRYQETSVQDDMHGELHCTECNITVMRHHKENNMLTKKAKEAKQMIINEMMNYPMNAKEIGAFKTLITTAMETDIIPKHINTYSSTDLLIIIKIAKMADYYSVDGLPEFFKHE